MITITVVARGAARLPGISELLSANQEMEIIACPDSLLGAAAWRAIGQSEVLVLDCAALQREGRVAIRTIHASFPGIRSLLLVEDEDSSQAAAAFSPGFDAVMVRTGCARRLQDAVSTLVGQRPREAHPVSMEKAEKQEQKHAILAERDRLH